MTRFALVVEYDGQPFMGWQRQAHGPSVQQALEALAAEFDRDGRGWELRQVAGGWRVYTRADCADVVERWLREGQQARLTQARRLVLTAGGATLSPPAVHLDDAAGEHAKNRMRRRPRSDSRQIVRAEAPLSAEPAPARGCARHS